MCRAKSDEHDLQTKCSHSKMIASRRRKTGSRQMQHVESLGSGPGDRGGGRDRSATSSLSLSDWAYDFAGPRLVRVERPWVRVGRASTGRVGPGASVRASLSGGVVTGSTRLMGSSGSRAACIVYRATARERFCGKDALARLLFCRAADREDVHARSLRIPLFTDPLSSHEIANNHRAIFWWHEKQPGPAAAR